jgi:hypothetical protein
MFPNPKRATTPPDINSHIFPFENIEPEVSRPFNKEFLSRETYGGTL